MQGRKGPSLGRTIEAMRAIRARAPRTALGSSVRGDRGAQQAA
jgi:hypothetical protein